MSFSEFFINRSQRMDQRLKQLEQMDSSPVVASAYLTSNKNIINSTQVNMVVDAIDIDTRNALDISSYFEFTAPIPGFYEISVAAVVNPISLWNGTSEAIFASSSVNNVASKLMAGEYPNTSGGATLSGSAIEDLDTGDTLEVKFFQTSGGTVSLFGHATTFLYLTSRVHVKRLRGFS